MDMTREVMLDLLPALLRRAVRVVPADEDDATGTPVHAGLARLADNGLLHRLAPGYYAVVPSDQIGLSWQPDLESASWGIAAADDGPRSVALMGLSAAHAHGAFTESPGVGVVATTRGGSRSSGTAAPSARAG
jgi:hypothetical protein